MILGSLPLTAELDVPDNVLWTLGVVAAVLVFGTVFRIINLLREPSEPRRERLRSQATWWVLFLALAVAVLGGPPTAVVLMAVLSLVGIREFGRLTHEQAGGPWIWPATFCLTVVHYASLYLGHVEAARLGMPLASLLVLVFLAVLWGTAAGFIRNTAVPFLGVMLFAYGPSHAAMLAIDAPWTDSAAMGTSGFLYLVLLTELHDIAQALWGRMLGSRKITPTLSPGKTWEGFLLGTATTVCLSMLLAPLFVPIDLQEEPQQNVYVLAALLSAGGGLVIALTGFLGDVVVSGVKRDCGVKDSGRLLPGQGGMLDRIDSLTLAAPAFYYYTLALGT